MKVAVAMPQHTAPPMDGLMDLLHEVRQFSRDLQKSARRAAPASGPKAYRDTLHALIDRRMQDDDPHGRVVCYASAAELGVPVELPPEQCRQAMSGGLGFGLRVLFWAAHRRMIAKRPVGNWAGLASHLARPASLKDKATAHGTSGPETT